MAVNLGMKIAFGIFLGELTPEKRFLMKKVMWVLVLLSIATLLINLPLTQVQGDDSDLLTSQSAFADADDAMPSPTPEEEIEEDFPTTDVSDDVDTSDE
jgi:hypothetical protein